MFREETILKRLVQKEKPTFRALAQNCLKLSFWETLSDDQRTQVFQEVSADIEALSLQLTQQRLSYKANVEDLETLQTTETSLQKQILDIQAQIENLISEFNCEKSQRANFLEYEEKAAQVNKLPTTQELQQDIETIDLEIQQVQESINYKQFKLDQIQNMTHVMVSSLHQLLDLSNTHF